MIELPRSCRYYLDKCREHMLKDDYVHALRMLNLAQTYADNVDDEYECFAEKLNIFDAVGADVLAVCYESIAKQAFGDEMYAALVNDAVAHKDVDRAAYYLDLYNSEGEDELPLITATDETSKPEEKKDTITVPLERLIADAHGDFGPNIKAVDSEEEYINGELKKALALALAGQIKAEQVREIMQLSSSNPKLEERICQVISQCAEALPADECVRVFRYLITRAANFLSVICDGSVNAFVRNDSELRREYDLRLLELTRTKDGIPKPVRRVAALALIEQNHPQEALEMLGENDISFADIFARRIYISALLMIDGGEEEGLAMLEDTLLLQDEDDRIVWEFYRKYGKRRCFEHFNCAYFSIKESVLSDAAEMSLDEVREIMQTTYGRFMFEDLAHTASCRSIPLDEEQMVAFICLYTDYQPEAALLLLYDHHISSRIKRNILHRFIYNNDVFDVKKAVFLTGVDRFVTIEDFGYVYRNDVIFGEEFDNWPDRVRAAAVTAVVDCCFYNNYKEGELFEAVKEVYEKMKRMRGTVAYNTIYRAVVLTLNPYLEDFYNITGMTEKDKKKIEAVAKKFGIDIK